MAEDQFEQLHDHDPFALLGGTEGGFISLEEIDESEYALQAAGIAPSETRKRKDRSEGSCPDDASAENVKKKKRRKKDRSKGKKKKTKKEMNDEGKVGEGEDVEEDVEGKEGDENCGADAGEEEDRESEFYSWNELRLHPLLMESIRRLGFKEPTPIQRACIPAAAHQGKDVIGAAETGSGKTLAFGLPILQRLLEEKDKSSRLMDQRKISDEVDRVSPLRALIITPTRELALQVTDHLKEAAKLTNFKVVPIVGGMYAEKQERLLQKKPEIVIGTPGRLWELMSGGNQHLVELHSVSFFVLDEADRMIENGHFHELQSIIDMLPCGGLKELKNSEGCSTVLNLQRKKRQTCVFSATIALSDNFRKKLKRGFLKAKPATTDGLTSIEVLSERAGMRPDVAVVDLTNKSIVAEKLEESFIECTEENKDAFLYYILSVHGQGQTIVFCTSIAALRRITSLLRVLCVSAWGLHSQMQQRARLTAIDRFRTSEDGILVATDIAARGLDIPGVRTVVHYQLPHSAEVYIHRSGRTARAASDGCSIALISPTDRMKFFTLCKSLSKDNLLRFPVDDSYMFAISRRISLACQIDKVLRKVSQDSAKKSWVERNAEAIEMVLETSDSEEEVVQKCKEKKASSHHLQKLQQELKSLLARPLQARQFSRKFLAGSGVSTILQKQLEELTKKKQDITAVADGRRPKLVVIGQDCIEPLQALRTSGHQVSLNNDKRKEMRKVVENWKKKKQAAKRSERDERRKKRKERKQSMR